MNKLIKNEITWTYIGAFGLLLTFITRLYNYELLSNIFFGITLLFGVILYINIILYLSKFKKRYIDDKLNKESITTKITNYKKNKKLKKFTDIILIPLFFTDILLGYFLFKDEMVETSEDYMIYFAIILVVVFTVKSIISSIKELTILNTVDKELKSEKIESIKGIPKAIKPLYYTFSTKGDKLGVGYGIKLIYDNELELIVLIDYPNIGKRKMKKLIDEDLMGKKYEFKYLKTSKIVIDIDNKIIKALS